MAEMRLWFNTACCGNCNATKTTFIESYSCKEMLAEMAYQSPECKTGILNPSHNLIMACDKCGYKKNISNVAGIYPELKKYIPFQSNTKTVKVPVTWMVYDKVEVEVLDSLSMCDARRIIKNVALDDFTSLPTPVESNYVDNSEAVSQEDLCEAYDDYCENCENEVKVNA